MIIDMNRYNGGGGSGSGVTPEQVQQQINSALTPYWESGETKDYVDGAVSGISLEGYATSGDMQSAFTLISETQQVAAAGLNQLEGRIDELSGATPDLSAYYTSAQTDAAIAQAVSGLATEQYVQDALSGVNMDNYWTSAETQNAIDEAISGFTPSANSPIIPAITTQAEYEAISGDVKTGDLIEVQGVVLDGYDGPQDGLFRAIVREEEDGGVVRKIISWGRRDNEDSVTWSSAFPWMGENGIQPIDFQHSFLIAPDELAEDEAYNGIGFDIDGKPVITHFSPQYDDDGEVTGITREDTPIGADMSAYYTSAQTENAITSKNYVTSAQVETQIVSKNYITSAETANFVTSTQVETQITSKGYATVSQIPTVPTSNTAFTNDAGYVTSAQVETQILEKNYITSADIADMVTSTYVSTIWRGTQSDYDAIVDKDPNTFYIIVSN